MNNLFRNIMSNEVDMARNRASWDGASEIERATFGKVFNFIEGILGLIAIFGCFLISGAIGNNQILLWIVGIIWLIPFILIGGLIARFRHAIFMRLRGFISGMLGGGR
jgi:hypothetical protein